MGRIVRAVAAFLLASGAYTPACAEITNNEVKIGVLTDLSGPFAESTGRGAVEAATMAREDFGGKVRGKPIVIISADHQNKPDVGSAIARQWFDREGVDVIAD